MSTSERPDPAELAAAPPSVGASSLEQVREILFGPQQRELTRRLARVDIHSAAQAEELRHETGRRLEVLEAYVRKELEGLVAATESQRALQLEGIDKTTREMREAIRSLEQRVAKLEEGVVRTQRELREQILAQAKSFVDEVHRARQELGAIMERQILVTWGEGLEPEAGSPPPLEEAGHREAA
jgi:hypothetical protein